MAHAYSKLYNIPVLVCAFSLYIGPVDVLIWLTLVSNKLVEGRTIFRFSIMVIVYVTSPMWMTL